MNHSEKDKQLDALLADSFSLRPRPDFDAWREKHPETVASLRALPVILKKRRATMTRIFRYGAPIAAICLILVAALWWEFFGHGTKNALADMIEQLGHITNATCKLRIQSYPFDIQVFMNRDVMRSEGSNDFSISIEDYEQGKTLQLDTNRKTATITNFKNEDRVDLFKKHPLHYFITLKDDSVKQLPDEKIGETSCKVFQINAPEPVRKDLKWIKVWIDPQTDLPMQVHMVYGDGQATVTLSDFHWNVPLDEKLFSLDVPEGYKIVQEGQDVKKETPKQADAVPEEKTIHDIVHVEEGREIKGEEIADTFDMLAREMRANYESLQTWSGKIESQKRFYIPNYEIENEQKAEVWKINRAEIVFSAKLKEDIFRLDYREVEPEAYVDAKTNKTLPRLYAYFDKDRKKFVKTTTPPLSTNSATDNAKLSSVRGLKTNDCLYLFAVNYLEGIIDNFPKVEGFNNSQRSRVLYRYPRETEDFDRYPQLYLNPSSLFTSESFPGDCWKSFVLYGKALRGKSDKDIEFAKRFMLIERHKGEATEYVLYTVYGTSYNRPVSLSERVYSSEAGFNLISYTDTFFKNGLFQAERWNYRKENGVYVPVEYEIKKYRSFNEMDSSSQLYLQDVYNLKETHVNEPVDPTLFDVKSFGFRYGDRLADWIEKNIKIYDGKEFVPPDQFHLDPELLQNANEQKQSP